MKSFRQQILEREELFCARSGKDAFNDMVQLADWVDDSITSLEISRNQFKDEKEIAEHNLTKANDEIKRLREVEERKTKALASFREDIVNYQNVLNDASTWLCGAMNVDPERYESDQSEYECYRDCFREVSEFLTKNQAVFSQIESLVRLNKALEVNGD